MHRKIKGRLKVCSASIVFDPDDVAIPIMKFPFKEVVKIEIDPKKTSSEGTEMFYVESSLVVEMKENNFNTPYKFRKVNPFCIGTICA